MDEARRREEEMEAFRAGGGSFMERVSSGIYRDTRTGLQIKPLAHQRAPKESGSCEVARIL